MAGTLGRVNITAGGTPQQITTQGVGAGVAFLKITPDPANAGVGYVGAKGMVKATGVNVMGVIAKPASTTTGPFAPFELQSPMQLGGIRLDQLYLDGTTNDGFYVTWT